MPAVTAPNPTVTAAPADEPAPPAPHKAAAHDRLTALDGWRAISILLVLLAHMLPLGKKSWDLNKSAGYMGMAIFFTLSGFLITTNLERNQSTPSFFIRRLCRILPLAYLYSVLSIVIIWSFTPAHELQKLSLVKVIAGHALFLLNYETTAILPLTAHFWSLCVEIHFYLAIGLLMFCTRFRGWLVLPVLFFAVLVFRFRETASGNINTHLRVDEILSGACLALAAVGILPKWIKAVMVAVPLPVWIGVLVLSSLPIPGPIPFFLLRSTAAAGMVGHTMFGAPGRYDWLSARPLRYLANISFALYVFHPMTVHGWLDDGGKVFKYLVKRPISFALTFAAAHVSTNFFEAYWIALGRIWSKPFDRRTPAIIADVNIDRFQNAKATV